MNILSLESVVRAVPAFSLPRGRESLALALLLCATGVPVAVKGQTASSDDFNDGTDQGSQGVWTHYDPAAAGGPGVDYTFPPDGNGGSAYRMYAAPANC